MNTLEEKWFDEYQDYLLECYDCGLVPISFKDFIDLRENNDEDSRYS